MAELEAFDPDSWEGDPNELPEDFGYDPEPCEVAFASKHEAFAHGHQLGYRAALKDVRLSLVSLREGV